MASAKHKKRLLKELASNPAFRVEAGAAWLCPYCGEVVVREARRDESTDEHAAARALEHFERCAHWHEFEGRVLPLADLQARAGALRAREQVRRNLIESPSWQLYDVTRRWYCPYCAKPTQAYVPEGGRVSTPILREIERHLVACEGYERGRGAEKPLATLKSMVAYANRTRKMAEQIRRKIEADSAWRLRDAEGRWVCPYCRKVQEHIDFSAPIQMMETAPLEISKHLISRCDRFQGQRDAGGRGPGDAGQSSVSLEIARIGAAPTTDLVRLSGQPPAAVSGEFPIPTGPVPARGRGARPPPSIVEPPRPPPFGSLDASGSGSRGDSRLSASESRPSDDDTFPRLAPAMDDPEPREDPPSRHAYGAPTEPREPAPPRKPGAARRDAIDAKLASLRSMADPTKTGSGVTMRASDTASNIALPEVEGLELRSFFRGAQTHPLDFIDAIVLDARRLAIAVGGVSGEGAETGLVLPMVRNLFRMHAKKGRPPGEVLRKVNADLFADLDNKTFVSVLYGILDVQQLSYRFARAGTNAPILFNPAREPDLEVLDSPGMVLGIDRGPMFEKSIEERDVRLEPDDLIVQFTHGTVAAENVDSQEIGLARIQDLIRRYGRHEADYLCAKLASFFEDWTRGAALPEDACLLAFKIKP